MNCLMLIKVCCFIANNVVKIAYFCLITPFWFSDAHPTISINASLLSEAISQGSKHFTDFLVHLFS